MTSARARHLVLKTAFVVAAGIAGLSALGLAFGAWAAIASEGEPDAEFSWARYLALMGGMAAVAVVFGLVAVILNRRVSIMQGRIVDPMVVPDSAPPPERT